MVALTMFWNGLTCNTPSQPLYLF